MSAPVDAGMRSVAAGVKDYTKWLLTPSSKEKLTPNPGLFGGGDEAIWIRACSNSTIVDEPLKKPVLERTVIIH